MVGTFTMSYWLIVAIYLGLLAVLILMANPDKTLTRKPYAFRIAGIVIAWLVLILVFLIVEETGTEVAATVGKFASIALIVVVVVPIKIIFPILTVLWSVHRTQDIGWSKWWCLLLIIPPVSLAFIVLLIFAPGQKAEKPA